MYWNNPIIEVAYPSEQDPIAQSLHSGTHCLFYNPAVPKQQIRYQQTLQDICNWANYEIKTHGITGFINNPLNYYDIANIVKLNMWIDDIKKQGIVKPMLLFYDGEEKFGINNGESRLRALERIPSIDTMSAFVATCREYADQFDNLMPVTTFEQFAQLCGAVDQQQFLFTLTDPLAPYGLFWYEYNSDRTRSVTPGEAVSVGALHSYLNQYPEIVFTPEWFDILISWANYMSNS